MGMHTKIRTTKTTYDEEGLLVAKTTNADTPEQKITLTSYDVKFRTQRGQVNVIVRLSVPK